MLTPPAQSSEPVRSSADAGSLQRERLAQGFDGVVVALEGDVAQRRLALGFGGAQSRGGEICRAGGDR